MKNDVMLMLRTILIGICLIASPVWAIAADFIVGAGAHVGQNKVSADSTYALLRYGGFSSFRDEVYWSRLERAKGVLAMPDNLADLDRLLRVKSPEGRLSPLIVLDYGNAFYDEFEAPRSTEAIDAFARYCAYVVRRYGDKVALFEVWNEWNGGMGSRKNPRQKGSAEDYVRLLEKAVPAIRAAAPRAVILGGATAGYDRKWTDDFIRAGGLKWIDGFSVHPYVYNHPLKRLPEEAIGFVEMLEEQLRSGNGGRDVPVYVTEIGWPTHEGKNGVSESLAADYMVRFLALATTLPYVRGVWYHELVDSGNNASDREHRFGIARSDLSPKAALDAAKVVVPILRTGRMRSSGSVRDGVRVVTWDMPEKDQITAIWSPAGPTRVTFDAKVSMPNGLQEVFGKADMQTLEAARGNHRLSIQVDSSPIFLRHPAGALADGR